VFSLGGVLYFAATGMTPFGAGHLAVMLYRIVHTEPDLAPLPPRLRDLIAACMAKDLAQRATPAELSAALMDVVPPEDSPATFWPGPVARLIRDHQAGLALGPRDSGRIPRPRSGWGRVTTGKLQWRYRAGGAIRSQILVASGVIYFGSLDHRVYALRA